MIFAWFMCYVLLVGGAKVVFAAKTAGDFAAGTALIFAAAFFRSVAQCQGMVDEKEEA